MGRRQVMPRASIKGHDVLRFILAVSRNPKPDTSDAFVAACTLGRKEEAMRIYSEVVATGQDGTAKVGERPACPC